MRGKPGGQRRNDLASIPEDLAHPGILLESLPWGPGTEVSITPYLLRARARSHTHTHTRVKELGTSNQQQAKCPRSTCPLTAHFQLARSAKTGARPPGTAASPRVPCPRLCFLNSSSWSPANKRCFPRREDNKNKPPLPAAPPSNFRNYSQLTGMQATGSLATLPFCVELGVLYQQETNGLN